MPANQFFRMDGGPVTLCHCCNSVLPKRSPAPASRCQLSATPPTPTNTISEVCSTPSFFPAPTD